MRFFFIFAAVLFICPILSSGFEFDIILKCAKAGKFVAVLPVGPGGAKKIEKMAFEVPHRYKIKGEGTPKMNAYLCQKQPWPQNHFSSCEGDLFTLAEDGDTLTLVLEEGKVTISSEKQGGEIHDLYWEFDDLKDFAKRSKVDIGELQKVL